jgi:hypothetical protein
MASGNFRVFFRIRRHGTCKGMMGKLRGNIEIIRLARRETCPCEQIIEERADALDIRLKSKGKAPPSSSVFRCHLIDINCYLSPSLKLAICLSNRGDILARPAVGYE